MAEPTIRIEVVYAAVDRQELLALDVPVGTTVRAAATMSGLGERFPEVDIEGCPLGIFGKVVDDPERRELVAGDRVEIYRPLLADPKEVRRLRALKAASLRKAHKAI